MKSGGTVKNRLIGPGDNNYGRGNGPDIKPAKKPEIVRELTPELAGKIWADIKGIITESSQSKRLTLHTLKQLKAQMGKIRKKALQEGQEKWVDACMDRITKDIEWITNNW